MTRVLVTGATGFIGRALVSTLVEQRDFSVVAAVRRRSNLLPDSVTQNDGLHLDPDTDWTKALDGVSCVIHLAGVVPATLPAGADASMYQRINVDGSLALARQAISAGVTRFIFMSSIGVNGSVSRQRFTPFDTPAPANAYAMSKYRAEAGLQKLVEETATELVVIRPPLVYGPHAAGKFRQLMRALAKGRALPFGAMHNPRSYVALANLVSLVATCIDHPKAGNETFLVCDDEDLSTTELVRRTAAALGKPARMLPVPAWLLTQAATVVGKKHVAQSLNGRLQIDMAHTRKTLNWEPPSTVDEVLEEAANAFRASMREAKSPVAKKHPNNKRLRLLDVLLSLTGLIIGAPIFLILLIAGYFDTGSPLFRQQRVGRHQKPFYLLKFRTMQRDAPSVATHLADNAAITPLGRFLRKTKLDELPQLWNVLKGEMSLVGPRPGLFNQTELAAERHKLAVFSVRPGITGLSQVSGVDMSTPRLLAETDRQMLDSLTVGRYFRYIFLTATGKGGGDAITRA